MKNFIEENLPAPISKGIVIAGKAAKRQYRNVAGFLKYGSGVSFRKIDAEGASFWIALMPLKNGSVDEVIFNTGQWEKELDAQLKKNIAKNDVFVDIGANIGYHSLFVAAHLGGTGKVYSFEPIKSLADQLRQSVEKNSFANVEIINAGLSDREETLPFHIRKDNMGGSSIGSYEGLSSAEVSSTGTIVTKRLDQVIGKEVRVKAIKIDVEGHEFEALKGAERILKTDHPVIFMEFSPMFYEHDAPGKTSSFIDYLKSFGYKFYSLGESPVDLNAWVKGKCGPNMTQIDIICR